MRYKIVFVLNDLSDVSLNQSILKIALGLPASSFDVHFISLSSKGSLESKFSEFQDSSLNVFDRDFLTNTLTVTSFIKSNQPHLLVSQSLRSDYTIFLAKLVTSSKFQHIAIRRNYLFINNWIKNILYFFSTHLVSHNICVAKHLQNSLVNNLRVPRRKTSNINNGVKLPTNKSQDQQPPLITFTGRLISRKNVSFLIQALSQVEVDYHCLIIGSGEKQNNLIGLIKQLNLEKKISIINHSTNINQYLSKTSIFVMPSKNEAQSWSILEAMSFSIPCLVSNIPANQELITHQKHGLVFSLDNPDQLTSQITLLLSRPKLREKLGQNALEKIKKDHLYSTMIQNYHQFFLNYLKHHS